MPCHGESSPDENSLLRPLPPEEITRLARVFVSLGATKLRLTGGEPLLRHDLASLTTMLAGLPACETWR